MNIYNIFPLLAGKLTGWGPHLERAAEMSFDWIFVNPIQQAGRSGSLYSIADFFRIDSRLVDSDSELAAEDQVRAVCQQAESLGLRVMADLVVNHCAVDAPLVREHPEWFAWTGNGEVAHPSCREDGRTIVWRDLARFDWQRSTDREGLYRHVHNIVTYLLGLGFTGFRCDAAYQVPPEIWGRLIAEVRATHPATLFAAETLGCTPEQTRRTGSAGFDYLFNSVKWWDFGSPWLLEQQANTRHIAPSIGFPESHDTARLFADTGGSPAASKRLYFLAAFFSGGVMIPMGYELGFRKRLHVVRSRPEDMEPPNTDLRETVRQINRLRARHRVFAEAGVVEWSPSPHGRIAVLRRRTFDGKERALLVLNRDLEFGHRLELGRVRHALGLDVPALVFSTEHGARHAEPGDDLRAELAPGEALALIAPHTAEKLELLRRRERDETRAHAA